MYLQDYLSISPVARISSIFGLQEEEGYAVRCLELPGTISEGET